MSSFVISKQEYVKVAGVIGGIVKARNSHGRNDIWLFDYDAGKNMEPEGYLKRFVNCYEMNAESVAAQYHDDEVEFDPNDYKQVYVDAFKVGIDISDSATKLRNLAHELDNFAQSVSYQIEDPDMNMVVDQWFSKIIVLIMRLTDDLKYDRGSWGRFDLDSVA